MLFNGPEFIHTGRPVKVTSQEQFVPLYLAHFFGEYSTWGYASTPEYSFEYPRHKSSPIRNTISDRPMIKVELLRSFNSPPLTEYVLPIQRDALAGKFSAAMGSRDSNYLTKAFSGEQDFNISIGNSNIQVYPGLVYVRYNKALSTSKSSVFGAAYTYVTTKPIDTLEIGLLVVVKAKWIPVLRFTNWMKENLSPIQTSVNIPATDIKILKNSNPKDYGLIDTIQFYGSRSGLFTAQKQEGIPLIETTSAEMLSYVTGSEVPAPSLTEVLIKARTRNVSHPTPIWK